MIKDDELTVLVKTYSDENNPQLSSQTILKALHSGKIFTPEELYKADLSYIKTLKGVGDARYSVIFKMKHYLRELKRVSKRKLNIFTPQIKNVNDIDISTKEGKLLMAALACLSTTTYTNKTPDEIIFIVNDLAIGMFYK